MQEINWLAIPVKLPSVLTFISHNILLSKSGRYRFVGWTVQWMRNLQDHTQRVAVNGSMSRLRPMVSLKCQYGGVVLLNIFISGTDSGIECALSSSQTTPSCVVQSARPGDRMPSQRPRQAEQRAQENLVRLNKAKCKLCPWVVAAQTIGSR